MSRAKGEETLLQAFKLIFLQLTYGPLCSLVAYRNSNFSVGTSGELIVMLLLYAWHSLILVPVPVPVPERTRKGRYQVIW